MHFFVLQKKKEFSCKSICFNLTKTQQETPVSRSRSGNIKIVSTTTFCLLQFIFDFYNMKYLVAN